MDIILLRRFHALNYVALLPIGAYAPAGRKQAAILESARRPIEWRSIFCRVRAQRSSSSQRLLQRSTVE